MAAQSVEKTLEELKKRAVRLPKHPAAQRDFAARVSDMLYRLDSRKLAQAVQVTAGQQKEAAAGSGSNVTFSLPRYFDPRMAWDAQYGPSFFNMEEESNRKLIHEWCRLFEATHPIIGACIDIYARFPVVDIDLVSDDRELDKFYTELFLEDLNLQEHFVNMGKEYWTVGEVFSLGDWDADLGIWRGESLIWPNDVEVETVDILGETFFYLTPPEHLRQLVNSQQPYEQYKAFEQAYPELVEYIRRNERIPVNKDVMSFIARKATPYDMRGTPVLVRGFKTLMLEDRLEGAMQAVADRLYSPLLMFKLGIESLPDGTPWIPTADQLNAFQSQLDLALSSEFRAIVTHFGVQTESVFGRELAPNYKSDRDMIDERLFMVFGLTSEMLQGSSGQPYASSALRMEFVSQMLASYQKLLIKHYNARARVVAEAQGHYETEKKGNQVTPVMERYLVVNDDGEEKIEERPKLKWPKLKMRSMSLRDEAEQRQFLKEMRSLGVPVADADLMVGVEFDFDKSLERSKKETIQKKIAEAEVDAIVDKALAVRNLDKTPHIDEITVIDTSDIDVRTDRGDDSSDGGKKEEDGDGHEEFAEEATGGGGRPNISDDYERKAANVVGKRRRIEMPIVATRADGDENDSGKVSDEA